jgi:hypothetical protein
MKINRALKHPNYDQVSRGIQNHIRAKIRIRAARAHRPKHLPIRIVRGQVIVKRSAIGQRDRAKRSRAGELSGCIDDAIATHGDALPFVSASPDAKIHGDGRRCFRCECMLRLREKKQRQKIERQISG